MKYKKLGKTNISVSVIGQGCGGIGGYLTRDSQQDDSQLRALRLGMELGMTFIDTAEAYGEGHSEELVGKAIAGLRDQVFLATKFSPEHNGYHDVLKSAEGSLRRLGTDHIDLYQVHWPNPQIPIGKTMRATARLIKEGKVRYIGVCNFSLKQLKEVRAILAKDEIVSIQVEYNLFDRSIENGVLPYCESEGITTIAYSPLNQGKVIGGDKKTRTLEMVARKYNRTTAQVALNWLISHPSVLAIPRATNPDHVKENATSSEFELSQEDFEEIGRVFSQECVYVPVDRIRVITGGQENRQVYQTVEEAIENRLGFVPSPVDLARDIRDGELLKPVRVVRSADKTGKCDYDLIEGRIRYWAWVIAYNGEKPVPVYIRDT